MTIFWIAQIIGGIAVPIGIMRFQFKKRKTFMLCGSLVAFLVTVQFFLLGAFSATVMAGLTIMTNAISGFRGEQMPWVARASIGLIACLAMWLFSSSFLTHWWSWMPMLSFFLGRLAETFINQKPMRLTFVLASLNWLIYGFLTGSFATMALEGSNVFSNLLGLWRITHSSMVV